MTRPPIANRAVFAARVDDELRTLAGLELCVDAIGGVVRKVAEAAERVALVRLDRRLRVRPEQLVTPVPEPIDGIRSGCAVQVADPAPPVDEVEQGLGVSPRLFQPQ